MPDNKYCYPGSDVLINKLNIRDAGELFEADFVQQHIFRNMLIQCSESIFHSARKQKMILRNL